MSIANAPTTPRTGIPPKPIVNYRPDWWKLIPAELKERVQWVVWKYVWKKKERKWTKLPFRAKDPTKVAAVNDPATWSSFHDAARCFADVQNGKRPGVRLDGVGFVFSADDPYAGADLDNCMDEAGKVREWAKPHVEMLATYGEISPSGNGIKFIARASLPGKGRKQGGVGPNEGAAVEMYDNLRFFTITGNVIDGAPSIIPDLAGPIAALYRQLFPTKESKSRTQRTAAEAGGAAVLPDDQTLLAKARAAKNGATFCALYDAGDTSGHRGDWSVADLALCSMLAFWFGGDHDAIDRNFRQSRLYRDKWDEVHGEQTYGDMTIEKALELQREHYTPRPYVAPFTLPGTDGLAPPNGDDHHARNGTATAEPSANGDGAGSRGPSVPTDDRPAGRFVKANDDPHRLARHHLQKHFQHFDGTKTVPTLAHHRDEFHRWDGSAYKVYRDVEADLIGAIEDEFNRLNAKAIEEVLKGLRAEGVKECPDDDKLPKAMKVTSGVVKNTLGALKSETCVAWDESAPLWLDDDGSRTDPLEVLPAKNGLVDLTTRKVMSHTPLFFSPFCLDYDFVPDAKPAKRWIEFLGELFPGDAEAVRELQKWFGYALTPDTSQHKILLMVGPPRSGKGTISRVLTRLIGAHNIVNPTLASMTTNFGLQAFLGKFVAIIGDARVSGSSSDKSIIVERLLNISGEDDITIDRKYKDQLTTKLKTRLMIFSNDPPNFRDASTALVNRFSPFKLTQSWLGREDLTLGEALYAELPEILNWAIEGRKLLKEDKKFFVPESGKALFDELKELTSPVMSFVDECCNLLPGDTRDADDLTQIRDIYHAWVEWCRLTGHESGSDNIFGRNLGSAYPAMKVERPRIDGPSRPRRYRGIQLNARGEMLRQQALVRNAVRNGPQYQH